MKRDVRNIAEVEIRVKPESSDGKLLMFILNHCFNAFLNIGHLVSGYYCIGMTHPLLNTLALEDKGRTL